MTKKHAVIWSITGPKGSDLAFSVDEMAKKVEKQGKDTICTPFEVMETELTAAERRGSDEYLQTMRANGF